MKVYNPKVARSGKSCNLGGISFGLSAAKQREMAEVEPNKERGKRRRKKMERRKGPKRTGLIEARWGKVKISKGRF